MKPVRKYVVSACRVKERKRWSVPAMNTPPRPVCPCAGDHDDGKPQDLHASLTAAEAASASDAEAQFIARWVGGNLLTEMIVRDAKEYPTTRRELEDEARLRSPAAYPVPRPRALACVGGTGKRRRLLPFAATPPSLQGRAHELEEEAVMKRADVKREEGNQAFKEGNWAQAVRAVLEGVMGEATAFEPRRVGKVLCCAGAGADCSVSSGCALQAVFYTQAITIKATATSHANRAAAFLKLGEHEKARAGDADFCSLSLAVLRFCCSPPHRCLLLTTVLNPTGAQGRR